MFKNKIKQFYKSIMTKTTFKKLVYKISSYFVYFLQYFQHLKPLNVYRIIHTILVSITHIFIFEFELV